MELNLRLPFRHQEMNPLNHKTSIKNTIQFFMQSILLSVILVIGFFWVKQVDEDYRHDTMAARNFYEQLIQKEMKADVLKTRAHIRYEISRIKPSTKTSIRERVYEASGIATRIYQNNKGQRTDEEIKKLISDILGAYRLNNGRNYYFICSLEGYDILNTYKTEFELKDTSDKKNLKNILIDIVNDRTEGFYTSNVKTKSGGIPKHDTKIMFVRLFKPFNWLIGTGEYMGHATKVTQHRILDFMDSMAIKNDKYFFAGDWKGNSLAGPEKGKNMLNITDSNGKKIVQSLINVARNDSGFDDYILPPFNTGTPRRKLSYVAGIKEWQWYIGTGRFVDDIEKKIQVYHEVLKKRIRNSIIKILSILLTACVVLSISMKYLFNRLNESFDTFNRFFENAAVRNEKIDSTRVNFLEFRTLSGSANKMVDERLLIEEKRKLAEKTLQKSEKRFYNMASVSPSGIFQMNKHGALSYCNKRFKDIMNIDKENISKRIWINVIYPDDRGRIVDAWEKSIREQIPFNHEYRIQHDENTLKWVLCNAVPEFEGGRYKGFIGVFTEITNQKTVEGELRQYKDNLEKLVKKRTAELEAANRELVVAKDAAEMAVKMKNEFLANMRHEMKTPLNAILGMSELVLKMELSQSQQESLEIVRRSSEKLLHLINDILDFSQIDAGNLLFDSSEFPVKSLIGEITDRYREKITEKDVQIIVTILPGVPDIILTDPTRIGQVYENLLGNAVKFTEQGEITIRVSFEALSQRRGRLSVSIEDTGVGIDFSQLPEGNPDRLFDAFIQCDGSATRQFEGTGLGLAISKKIVEYANGEIHVKSEPGKGSHFSISIEVQCPSMTDTPYTSLKSQTVTDDLPALDITTHSGSGLLAILKKLAIQLQTNDFNADDTFAELVVKAGQNYSEIIEIKKHISSFEYNKAGVIVTQLISRFDADKTQPS